MRCDWQPMAIQQQNNLLRRQANRIDWPHPIVFAASTRPDSGTNTDSCSSSCPSYTKSTSSKTNYHTLATGSRKATRTKLSAWHFKTQSTTVPARDARAQRIWTNRYYERQSSELPQKRIHLPHPSRQPLDQLKNRTQHQRQKQRQPPRQRLPTFAQSILAKSASVDNEFVRVNTPQEKTSQISQLALPTSQRGTRFN